MFHLCLTAAALLASTAVLLPQKPMKRCTVCLIWGLGCYFFICICYIFTLCKSHKAASVGWFGFLGKVMPNSPHLFLFGNFLQLRGISLIFYIHPSFVFPREKEIHSDTDSSSNFKPVAWGSQIQINKILSCFASEAFVSESFSWFSEQKARSKLSGRSSLDWQSYI